jgi:hypothetical protein
MLKQKAYQIFIGCPFAKEIRTTYDRLKKEIEAETPLSLILADTVGVSSSDYLLESITALIGESAACIFDATGANANVSLEVGIAHTIPVEFILTMKTRKPTAKAAARHAGTAGSREVRSIISDLQGKNRIEYKQYDKLRHQLEQRFISNLPFMKRWHAFKAQNKAMAPHALSLFHDLRTSQRSQKSKFTAQLEGTGFSATQVLDALTSHKLIVVKQGRNGGIFYVGR